jgi:hypothetical protein
MLPRYRCSLLVGNRLACSVYRPSGFGFYRRRRPGSPSGPKRTSGRFLSHVGAKLDLAAFARNSLNHEDYLGHRRTCGDHHRRRDLFGRHNDK